MKIVIQGCLITTIHKYIKFSYSNGTEITDSVKDDCLYIKFRRGFHNTDIYDDRIKVLNDLELTETGYIKVANYRYEFNGIVFTKLIPHDYVFSQYLIDDIDDVTMLYDDSQCQMMIPSRSDYDVDKYITVLNQNPYIEVIDTSKFLSFKNFYCINLSDKDIKLESSNDFRFNTKQFYTRYLLEPIDSIQAFISKIKTLLQNYSIDLLRYPIDENTNSTHYVVYRINDLDKQLSHKSGFEPLNYAVKKVTHIEFEITTPDMVVLNDFKSRYQNLLLLSNFTTFSTEDKIGRSWSASVNWSPISSDFNQDYDQDSQGNIAFKASFSADLYYYVIFDEKFYDIQSIVMKLSSNDTNLIKITIE